jgi:hypothetical protein
MVLFKVVLLIILIAGILFSLLLLKVDTRNYIVARRVYIVSFVLFFIGIVAKQCFRYLAIHVDEGTLTLIPVIPILASGTTIFYSNMQLRTSRRLAVVASIFFFILISYGLALCFVNTFGE